MQTLAEPKLENIALYYREGSSDKVYQCAIEQAGPRFVVNFAYGRRGSTMNTGTKTNVPVDYDDAKRIFDKLVKEKTAKGYTPGENSTPYQHSDKQTSGILCQLLNAIEETEVEGFINDTIHGAQEKFDGRRMLIQKQGGTITGINRKGLTVGIPAPIFHTAARIPGDFIMDGEAVGDTLHCFDLLTLNGRDLTPLAYWERYLGLMNLMAAYPSHHKIHHIKLADLYTEPGGKAVLLKALKAQKKEGIVLKRLDAPYTPGKPNSGGSQLKHKFYATLSAGVAKINQQRSVKLQLLGQDGWVTCGNVTIPANHQIPGAGQVVEIRYLYAFRESGVLYQPVYLGPRDDVDDSDCLTSQLKFKAEEE